VYYTLRAAAPHISHPGGYALAISSLAAAVHPPLLGAYSASKAGVEALADSLRVELAGTGARVGVAYFAELDTDMTKRGFGTKAASELNMGPRHVAPLKLGIDAIERGVIRRAPSGGAALVRAGAPSADVRAARGRGSDAARAKPGSRRRAPGTRAADHAAAGLAGANLRTDVATSCGSGGKYLVTSNLRTRSSAPPRSVRFFAGGLVARASR
jgi:NAD(P)-dependent dehydrogenase (short-subunit alcohol dehydrogenase family)